MKKQSKKVLLFAAALCLCMNQWPSTALAASQTVMIQNFAFNPPTLTINVGDTVTWMNQDSAAHTSTSDATPPVWDSGLLPQGMSFPFTFTTAGNFAYHCTVHPFMHGSLTVSGAGGGTPPVVQIISPANGATFTAPTNVIVTATASSTSGSISNVQFLDGPTSLGIVTTAPYTVTIPNIAAGAHQLSAKATDNTGATTISAPVTIQVNAATTNTGPTVQITSPASGATFTAPTNVIVTATATSTSGSISNVEFLDGANSIGFVTTAPYSVIITNITVGAHQLTAKATDNMGATTVSAPVTIQVNAATTNTGPTVQITSPASGATFTAPTNVTVTATASSIGGSISNVQFLDNTNSIGIVSNAPYSVTITNISAGSHELTAKATDTLGASTVSGPVRIEVLTITPITNQPPMVELISPGAGAVFPSPANITLEATATAVNATVSNVTFLAGSNVLGVVTQSPYSLTWSNVPPGTYSLSAKAADDQGRVGVSSQVSVSVSAAIRFAPHNIGSDLAGVADVTDTNVVNPWGIAASPTGPFVISDNASGNLAVYNTTGVVESLIVTIPPPTNGTPPAAPTGIVFNSDTNSFLIASNQPATFIVATEDGTIAAWNNGSNAVIEIDNSSSNAVYKGLTIASVGGSNNLYATDFHNGKIDVFDANFKPVPAMSLLFSDPAIPTGFAPFGIQNLSSNLYVTYAMQDANRHDDVSGPGNGFVDVFSPAGNLLSRFATNGPLNSPWGIAQAPSGFGPFAGALLIGNFGDGRINVFDPTNATFMGPLMDSFDEPISISGLWGLRFGNGGMGGDAARLYFTAGIAGGGNKEDHGLFGRISAIPVFLFTGISNTGTNLSFTWAGGVGPFVLQQMGGFSGTNWVDVLTTTNRDATAPTNGLMGAFRLKDNGQTQ